MKPIDSKERRDLQAIFFYFGLGVMSLAPRLPEIKANLGVSTTFFGFLLSSGSIGAISAHLTMGHITHRFGVYRVLIVSSVFTYLSLGIMIELHNPWLYILANIICGFSWASYHIAINAQALHRQAEDGRQIIPMLHGMWTAGSVATAFIAILISSTVSLYWHIYTLIIFVFIMKMRSIHRLKSTLLKGSEVTEADEIVTFRQMISSFSIDWIVSLGFLCALMMEVSMGDWITILARQEFEVSKSAAVIPFFLFSTAMIAGRFGFARLKGTRSDKQIVQPLVIVAGIVFLISLFLGLQIKESSKNLGFFVFCLGVAITGLGMSFVGPLFFGYSSARSDKPGGVAIAELGALNQVLTFVGRGVISVVAGVASLPIAMIIPAVMLVGVAFFVAAASQPRHHR